MWVVEMKEKHNSDLIDTILVLLCIIIISLVIAVTIGTFDRALHPIIGIGLAMAITYFIFKFYYRHFA